MNLSDKAIKCNATKAERVRVFEHMNAPRDIIAECSTGTYVRKLWKNANGVFGWDKWELLWP